MNAAGVLAKGDARNGQAATVFARASSASASIAARRDARARAAAREQPAGAAVPAPGAATPGPAGAPDALSEVLRRVRLSGAVFLNAELTAPWAVESPPSHELAPALLPRAAHVVEYHIVVEGRCSVQLPGGEPLFLEAGDLVMLPHGDAHRMASGPHLDVQPLHAAQMELPAYGEIVSQRYGGGGALTRLMCGYLALDPKPCRPLLGALPRMLRVDARDGDLREWLRLYLRLRANPSSGGCGPGGACVLSKLSELMFIDAVRRYVASLPPGQTGWLAGLRDPFVGRALGLIHQQPARPWTVQGLGRAVGMSRSALAERFAVLIGQPPMHYLTQWRLTLAAHLLQTTDTQAALVALDVGYDSEAAFNRAFKRAYGAPPARWRRGAGTAAHA